MITRPFSNAQLQAITPTVNLGDRLEARMAKGMVVYNLTAWFWEFQLEGDPGRVMALVPPWSYYSCTLEDATVDLAYNSRGDLGQSTLGTQTEDFYLQLSPDPLPFFCVPLLALGGAALAAIVRIEDGVGGNLATVAQFHNADNQVLPGTAFGLLTGGVAQLLNVLGNLDRQTETGIDGRPAVGIQSSAQQTAQTVVTVCTASIPLATVSINVSVGSSRGFLVGGVALVDAGGANPEPALVTAVPDATHVTLTFPTGGARFVHFQPFLLNTFLYNQTRDAAGELDGASGLGTAIAAEYEWTGGGPPLSTGLASGLAFDRGRNISGKGIATRSINATVAGDAQLVFPAGQNPGTLGLLPGMPILITGGAGTEVVFVRQDFVPATGGGAITVPLQSPVVTAGRMAAFWDTYAPLGPGTGAVLPFGIEIAEDVVWDPVSSRYYIEVAATADAVSGQNAVLEVEGLVNPGATIDRAHSLGQGDGLGAELAVQPPSTPLRTNGAAGAAVTNTYAAVGGQRHILTQLQVSFSAAPAAVVTLTVTDGATVVFETDLNNVAGTVGIPLPPGGIKGTVGNALAISVAAPGGAVVAKLSTSKLTA